MKRLIIFGILGLMAFNASRGVARANQKGETSHPVAKRTYTYE